MTQELINRFHEIENTPDILSFKDPVCGLLLWPFIRNFVYYRYWGTKEQIPQVQGNNFKRRQKLEECLFVLRKAWGTMKPWPKRKILFSTFQNSAYYKIYNGDLYNQYIEPFADLFPDDVLILNGSPGPDFIGKRQFLERNIQPIPFVAGKMIHLTDKRKFVKCAKDFVLFLRERFLKILDEKFDEAFFNNIESHLRYLIHLKVNEYKIFDFFLKNVGAKMFVLDGAFYGNYGHLIVLSKRLGIKVFDQQHGLIYPHHISYNWPESLCSSIDLQRQLPDFFLTYGTYWHEQLQLPGT